MAKSFAEHERSIRDAQDRVEAARALLEVRVVAAYEAGLTWARIAGAVGIRRQSAQERFGRLPEIVAFEEANR